MKKWRGTFRHVTFAVKISRSSQFTFIQTLLTVDPSFYHGQRDPRECVFIELII